jgi:hypothetical protein
MSKANSMNKINLASKAKANLSKAIPKGMSIAEATNILGSLTEIKKHQADIKKSEAEIKMLQVKEKLLVEEMSKKYELYHKVFNTIFKERSESINKSFDIIDKGLETDDKDLISMGLTSLSTVVASSPFANLNELGNLLESGNSIEL